MNYGTLNLATFPYSKNTSITNYYQILSNFTNYYQILSNFINPFTVKRKETFRAKSVLKKKVFKIA